MRDDLEDIRAAAIAELRKDETPAGWSLDVWRLVALNLTLCGVAVVAASSSRHPKLGEPLWALGALVMALTIIAGCVLAIRPSGRAAQAWALAFGLAVPIGVVTLASHAPYPPLFADWECALAELGIAVLPGVAMVVALKRFAYQPSRALTGGFAVGATGLLVLHVACAVTDLPHLLAFHITPYLIVAVVLLMARARLPSLTFVP